MTGSHHYPQPCGNYPHKAPPHHHHNHLFPNSSLITCISSVISLLWTSQLKGSLFPAREPPPFPPPAWVEALFTSSVALLSLLFLLHSFHLVGSLYRPVVAEREPDPRALSLAPPTMLCAQRRGGGSPVQTSVLMRASSLPSHGLRLPVLPAGEARLIGGYLQDEFGPRL